MDFFYLNCCNRRFRIRLNHLPASFGSLGFFLQTSSVFITSSKTRNSIAGQPLTLWMRYSCVLQQQLRFSWIASSEPRNCHRLLVSGWRLHKRPTSPQFNGYWVLRTVVISAHSYCDAPRPLTLSSVLEQHLKMWWQYVRMLVASFNSLLTWSCMLLSVNTFHLSVTILLKLGTPHLLPAILIYCTGERAIALLWLSVNSPLTHLACPIMSAELFELYMEFVFVSVYTPV